MPEESPNLATETGEDKKLLQDFMQKVKDAKKKMELILTQNVQIDHLKDQHVNATSAEQEKNLSDQLSIYIQANSKLQKEIKQLLDVMKVDIDESIVNYPQEPETRAKINLHATLAGQFKEILKNSQHVQTDFKSAVEDKIKRQLKIIKPELTDEELEVQSKDREATSKILNQQIMGKAHRRIVNAVQDIQSKYEDIKKLEQGVEEIFKLFNDLATLIQLQGEMLDSIEANVQQANDYMGKAIKHLVNAKKWWQKARCKMCCILICVVIILVAILVPVLKVVL